MPSYCFTDAFILLLPCFALQQCYYHHRWWYYPTRSITKHLGVHSIRKRNVQTWFLSNRKKRAKCYVAIFITNTSENVVWVANREHPFPNPSALLTMDPDGNLVISDCGLLHLVTNTTSRGNDAYAKLLDTCNLLYAQTGPLMFCGKALTIPQIFFCPEWSLKLKVLMTILS